MLLITLLIILMIALLLKVYFLFFSWWMLRVLSTMLVNPDYGTPFPHPSLSIVIPARNEQTNIRECVESILKNDYPIREIIVIDDGSADRTGEIVEEMRQQHEVVKLVTINELPPGWIGKSHALYQGVQHAKGRYLLFLDADVRLAPECITRTMGYALREDADLLTLFPVVKCVGMWEKVILPVIDELLVFSLMLSKGPAKGAIGANPGKPIAFGGYLLFKRDTYDAIGGHETVKGSIMEDVALAGIVRRKGYSFHFLLGWPHLLMARMYVNLRHIWEGWSKTIAGAKVPTLILSSGAILSIFILPWLSILLSLGLLWFNGPSSFSFSILTVAMCLSGLALMTRWYLARAATIDNSYPYLEWLGGFLIITMVLTVIVKMTFRQGVSWKGRRYGTYERIGKDKAIP